VAAAVADAGLLVTTAPGPSAVVAALTISGLSTERFAMEGFVPRKSGEREALYAQWMHEPGRSSSSSRPSASRPH